MQSNDHDMYYGIFRNTFRSELFIYSELKLNRIKKWNKKLKKEG